MPLPRTLLICRLLPLALLASALQAEPLEQPVEGPIRMEIDTGNPIRAVFPGAEERFQATITNTGEAALEGQIRMRVVNSMAESETSIGPIDYALDPDASMILPLPFPEDFGGYEIYYETEAADGAASSGRRSFVYLDPVGVDPVRDERFRFGLAWVFNDFATPRACFAAQQVGVDVYRIGSEWQALQPGPDEWNWGPLDERIDRVEEHGMDIQMLLGFTPNWAAPEEFQDPDATGAWGPWATQAPDLDAWRNLVRTMGKRYKGRIRLWEVWNEPDWSYYKGSEEDYVAMMRIAMEELKAIDPENRILTGGFARALLDSGRKWNPKLQEVLLRDHQDVFDIHALHEHSPFVRFRRFVDEHIIAARERYGATDKPLYFNETGYASNESFRHQTLQFVKKATFTMSRGAAAYFWFTTRDNPHGRMGWFDIDYYPKASYVAYNTMVDQLRGATFLRAFDMPEDQYLFLWEQDDAYVLTGWNDSGKTGAELLLATGNGEGRRTDLMGNARRLNVEDGRLLLQLDATPEWIRLPKTGDAPSILGELVALDEKLIAIPGRDLTVDATVWNPFEEPVDVRLSLSLDKLLDGAALASSQTVAPGEHRTVRLRLPVPEDFTPDADSATAELHYAYDGGPSGTIPVDVALDPFLLEPEFPEAPQWTLNRANQVYNLLEHDPAAADTLWQGPEDLSANAWLASDGKTLKLKVVVRDDHFHQPGVNRFHWRGDSLQVAVQDPGSKRLWVFSLAHVDGEPVRQLSSPPNQRWPNPSHFEIKRDGEVTGYLIHMPLDELGMDRGDLEGGVRMNLLVNDNDGEQRNGYLRYAPGFVTKKPELWPLVVIE